MTSARRCALVTGASAGIGRAFARRLAAEGYDLVLVARDERRLTELAEGLSRDHGVIVAVLPADLSDPVAVRRVEETVAERDIDLLINNAGYGADETDLDALQRNIWVMVIAVVRVTRAALPRMLARGTGAIISVSSASAWYPGPPVYAACKAFVNSFTEGLHLELAGSEVRVQALCPGYTRTEFQARIGLDPFADMHTLPEWWMSPEDVVAAALAGLRQGEVICVPGLEDASILAELKAVEDRLGEAVLTDRLASRYRDS